MKIRKLALMLLVLLLAGTSVFAQTGASGSGRSGSTPRYTLTVNSNVRNAQVFINAVLQKGATPLRLTLNAGTYSITVRSPGYRDYVANINLNRNLTLNATLQPVSYALTINANVRNASVFINNQSRGTAPVRLSLQSGRYNVRVEAAGYFANNQVVQLERDTVISVTLEPMNFKLNITSNVRGAQIFVDGNEVGTAPMQTEIAPGRHSLRLFAPGYYEYNQVVDLQENTNINVNLRRQMATISFNIPEQFLNTDVKDPRSQFSLYVDGRKISQSQLGRFEVEAGEHIIRIETGGMAFEAAYALEAGMSYGLQLDLLLLLEAAQG